MLEEKLMFRFILSYTRVWFRGWTNGFNIFHKGGQQGKHYYRINQVKLIEMPYVFL